MAKIILIFKADDNADANNYRPISLLSNFDRVCEKLIFNRMEYLKVCKLGYDHCSYKIILIFKTDDNTDANNYRETDI